MDQLRRIRHIYSTGTRLRAERCRDEGAGIRRRPYFDKVTWSARSRNNIGARGSLVGTYRGGS